MHHLSLAPDELHLRRVDGDRHFPHSPPVLVIVGEAGQYCCQDTRGVWKHGRSCEADELPDPGDGDHLELDVVSRLGRLGVTDQDVDHSGEVHHLRLGRDVLQELSENVVTKCRDLRTRVIQDVKQRVQELREMLYHLRVGDTVQQANPGYQELSDKLVLGVHSLPQDGDECRHLELLTFRHNVLEQPVQQLGAVLDVLIGVGHYHTNGAEDVGKHREDIVPGHLDHVIETLTRVISHSVVRVAQTRQNGVYQIFSVNSCLPSCNVKEMTGD